MGKFLAVSLLCVFGCGGSVFQIERAEGREGDAVANRARIDLGCRWVTIVHIGGDSFGADGCGLQATYTVICGEGAECVAALDQQVR